MLRRLKLLKVYILHSNTENRIKVIYLKPQILSMRNIFQLVLVYIFFLRISTPVQGISIGRKDSRTLHILYYKFHKICNNSYFFRFLGQIFEKYLPGPTLLNIVIGISPIGLPEKARV